ncbi:hypothetical protein KSP39_PZI002248 [Platanthera zijinensis]|uniref:Uncharacterized protein n=1 Tax=Platanthera zijinensis TaxID=2320716 RepID=A0AAP0BZH8_9ASPA
MEAELKASEPLKLELQQAQSEAQNLAAGKRESGRHDSPTLYGGDPATRSPRQTWAGSGSHN